jgi:hypothetical protein
MSQHEISVVETNHLTIIKELFIFGQSSRYIEHQRTNLSCAAGMKGIPPFTMNNDCDS